MTVGPVTVTLLDAVTGTVGVIHDKDFCPFQWAENNWSCDCNRDTAPEFAELEVEGQDLNYCVGRKRFLVVALDPLPESYTVDEFNEKYPEEVQAVGRAWRQANGKI